MLHRVIQSLRRVPLGLFDELATVLTLPLWLPLGMVLMGLGVVLGRLWSMFRYGFDVPA